MRRLRSRARELHKGERGRRARHHRLMSLKMRAILAITAELLDESMP